MRTRILTAAALALSLARPAAADVVDDWNALVVATVATQNPFAQARLAAIAHLAMFEAVNAITAEREPYLGTIAAPEGASPEAAAIAAAHAALVAYFPGSAAALDQARAGALAAIPDGPPKAAGVAVGEAAAAALVALRAADGSAPPQFYAPPAPAPGRWQATPGCPAAGGILLHWGAVTPFGLERGSQFRAAPPPSLESVAYAKDYTEVKAVGAAGSPLRPDDRAAVAQYYNAVLAVGVWNTVARQIAGRQPVSLTTKAAAFALLNMAIADALVSVMETKYYYAFWRPHTAIAAGGADGNDRTEPDASFVPFVPTPCFPSYPSAHASASYAARAVVQRFWGTAGHDVTLAHPSLPGIELRYTSLKQITDDIDDARVYGGIHFRFDQEAGAAQGRRIGGYLAARWLKPRE